jgi:hypothetical protein
MPSKIRQGRRVCPACCEEALQSTRRPLGEERCPWVDEMLAIFAWGLAADHDLTRERLHAMAPCRKGALALVPSDEGETRHAPYLRLL